MSALIIITFFGFLATWAIFLNTTGELRDNIEVLEDNNNKLSRRVKDIEQLIEHADDN